LWQSIVKAKIHNQGLLLQDLHGDDAGLARIAARVKSGDPDNLEGQAAAFYFPQLFGTGFQRTAEQWANSALDYGYAVLRGAITRGLVAHGLHPTIGLFHANEQNAFNLADDLIEPFRPIVDLHVAKHPAVMEGELNTKEKQALVALLNVDVGMPQGKMSVLSAVEYATESLVRVYETGQTNLELPVLIGLQPHRLEH
jgi:CRISPR-associated protein Cas1